MDFDFSTILLAGIGVVLAYAIFSKIIAMRWFWPACLLVAAVSYFYFFGFGPPHINMRPDMRSEFILHAQRNADVYGYGVWINDSGHILIYRDKALYPVKISGLVYPSSLNSEGRSISHNKVLYEVFLKSLEVHPLSVSPDGLVTGVVVRRGDRRDIAAWAIGEGIAAYERAPHAPDYSKIEEDAKKFYRGIWARIDGH